MQSSIDSELSAFRKKNFSGTTKAEWNSWQWQMKNRITTFKKLSSILKLSADELAYLSVTAKHYFLSITPHYATLLDRNDPLQAIRRTVVPTFQEHVRTTGESEDPLEEDKASPVPGIVHRYPDRVLFLSTAFCSVRCRYCTRSRMVGATQQFPKSLDWEQALAYIESNRTVRDVLISGGDPLTLSDNKLERLLSRLARIRHVNFVRLGTKVPAVLPQRITGRLIRIFKKYRPLWISLHFTHPGELTPEVRAACGRLADAGIPMGSQTVLLKGINDDAEVLKRLFQGLLTMRVRPYYLYQCDPILGSSHFRTPVSKGIEILEKMIGHTTGYAVPTFVIDAPGGGKVPLLPAYVVGRDGEELVLRNYKGNEYRYPDTADTARQCQAGPGALRE